MRALCEELSPRTSARSRADKSFLADEPTTTSRWWSPSYSANSAWASIGSGAPTWRRSSAPCRSTEVFREAAPAVARGDARRDGDRGLGAGRRDDRHRAPPQKSPRAFCAPVRVPDEVYLVIAPVGGREDFAALFHEAGHTEHYALRRRVASGRGPVPGRQLHHGELRLPVRASGLRSGVAPTQARHRGPGGDRRPSACEQARYLRRYPAKLAYELELHGGGSVDGLDAVYARRLSRSRGVRVAGGVLARGRRPVLLRRPLPARLGARDAPARRCPSASDGLVRRPGGRRVPEQPLARRTGREGAEGILSQLGVAELDFRVLSES